MHKAVYALRRGEDVAQEEFATYWREEHAPIVIGGVPNVVRYTLSFPDDAVSAPYDGVAEVYFEDRRALEEARDSRAMEKAKADWANFADRESALQLLVEEEELAVDRT